MRELILLTNPDTISHLTLANQVWLDALNSLEEHGTIIARPGDTVRNYHIDPKWQTLCEAADSLWGQRQAYGDPAGTVRHAVLYAVRGVDVITDPYTSSDPPMAVALNLIPGHLRVVSDSHLDLRYGCSGLIVIHRGFAIDGVGLTLRVTVPDFPSRW